MSNDFITIAKFTESTEAELARLKLEAAGIQCFLENQHIEYVFNIASINLKIWAKDKWRALEVLDLKAIPDEEEQTESQEYTVVCPYCKSTDTQYGVNRDYASIWYLVYRFFIQSFPFYKKKTYFCNKCKRHFLVENKD